MAGGVGYAWRIEPVWTETVRQRMAIPNLPPALAGLRIVQLSDLHVGAGVPLAYLNGVVDRVNASRPDLVVVTGDLVHHGQREWARPAARLLARLEASEGVIATLGNHDWGAMSVGAGVASWADRVETAMQQEGVRVLRNASTTIQRGSGRLFIVGLDDYWSENYDPATAFAGVPEAEPCIALSHNPDSFLDLLDAPADWTLAGHTHGGQVRIPWYGAPLLPVKNKQFVAGHYPMAGKHLYVNRGVGWLKRIRFNARPEITEFTLNPA